MAAVLVAGGGDLGSALSSGLPLRKWMGTWQRVATMVFVSGICAGKAIKTN